MKKWLVIMMGLGLVLSMTACAAKKQIPDIGEDGVLRAAMNDSPEDKALINNIAKTLGLTVEPIKAEGQELLSLLDTGEAELSAGELPLSGSLEDQYTVSIPYEKGRIFVVTRRGDFSDAAGDFAERKTGISSTLSQIALLNLSDGTVSAQTYSDKGQVETDLVNGAIDGYFCYEEDALSLCGREKLQAQSLVDTEAEQYVLVMRKGSDSQMENINLIIQQQLDQQK